MWPGSGTAGNLVCRYHGWAFDWDGKLKAARDFGDEAESVSGRPGARPRSPWRAGATSCSSTSATNPPPFDEAIAPFDAECEAFGIESFGYVRRVERDLACNWKTYADNYLEGYHVALLHPSLSRSLDMSTYRVDVPHRLATASTAPTRPPGSPSGGAWLFRYPNLAVNVYAEGMNVERIVPDGPRGHGWSTTTSLRRHADAEIARMVEMSNVVLDEDQAICEAVQRNLDAGTVRDGAAQPAPRGGGALVPVAEWPRRRSRA